jgi:hypothetical protein
MTYTARHLLFVLTGTACIQAQVTSPAAFDGNRAYEHVRQLVAIGPRVAGSPGAEKARTYIKNQLRALDLTVDEQAFDATTPLGVVKMVNLRSMLPGGGTGAGGRLIIAGHYDTKRFPEFSFVGANDGGSSAAFLIELARVLKGRTGALPIELLFLDGEEAVIDWHKDNDNTYGSRYYVDSARKQAALKDIRALVLVDMIGDRDLRIMRESNSTPWLTELIWTVAKRLKRVEFVDEETTIDDDHVPFLQAGVPAVDLIDLDYPAWHTAEDTLDKVSARSLEAVGTVLLAALPELEKKLVARPR